MDLKKIKEKFKHKVKADIKDLDFVLDAAPFLVREVERLEIELKESEKRLSHLSELLKRRPPLEKTGKKGDAAWKMYVNEKTNRLYIELLGKFEYRSAKLASNNIIAVLPNLRNDFDVINNIGNINPSYNKKLLFHLKKIMFSLKEIGVRRVISITSPDTPKEISRIFENPSGSENFIASSANSVSEAEGMLDNIAKFLKT